MVGLIITNSPVVWKTVLIDLDQLASSAASSLYLVLYCFQKNLYVWLQAKFFMHYLFFGTSKNSLDKYIMTIYLSLGKHQILLFPHIPGH